MGGPAVVKGVDGFLSPEGWGEGLFSRVYRSPRVSLGVTDVGFRPNYSRRERPWVESCVWTYLLVGGGVGVPEKVPVRDRITTVFKTFLNPSSRIPRGAFPHSGCVVSRPHSRTGSQCRPKDLVTGGNIGVYRVDSLPI